MTIEWKEITPDYIVSSDGQIGSRKRGGLKMLRPSLVSNGYLRIKIFTDTGNRTFGVHHLVAAAFVGPQPSPRHEVNHKNGIKTDNRDSNLEWVTRSGNQRHRFDVLGKPNTRGEKFWDAKLTETAVREIRAAMSAGEARPSIAKRYGVSVSTIHGIAYGKNWAWLDAGAKA